MAHTLTIPSPIGGLTLQATDTAVTAIRFGSSTAAAPEVPAGTRIPTAEKSTAEVLESSSPLLRQAAQELAEYFNGTRCEFTFPILAFGTPFQQEVWAALRTIPYGETRSYKQIAEQIGRPRACRAVGMANNRNPVAIAIPCHRVLGHDGALVGYAGGIDTKTHLLTLEQK